MTYKDKASHASSIPCIGWQQNIGSLDQTRPILHKKTWQDLAAFSHPPFAKCVRTSAILQHTATHCNTQHCTTLQRRTHLQTAATHSNILHYTTLHHFSTHWNLALALSLSRSLSLLPLSPFSPLILSFSSACSCSLSRTRSGSPSPFPYTHSWKSQYRY